MSKAFNLYGTDCEKPKSALTI